MNTSQSDAEPPGEGNNQYNGVSGTTSKIANDNRESELRSLIVQEIESIRANQALADQLHNRLVLQWLDTHTILQSLAYAHSSQNPEEFFEAAKRFFQLPQSFEDEVQTSFIKLQDLGQDTTLRCLNVCLSLHSSKVLSE